MIKFYCHYFFVNSNLLLVKCLLLDLSKDSLVKSSQKKHTVEVFILIKNNIFQVNNKKLEQYRNRTEVNCNIMKHAFKKGFRCRKVHSHACT